MKLPWNLLARLWRSRLMWSLAACMATAASFIAPRTTADPAQLVAIRGAFPLNSKPGDTFTVATFNIHGGVGTDGRFDLARIKSELDQVDFAALQEVHVDTFTPFEDQAEELGARLKRLSAFIPTERRWRCNHVGNGLVSRLPVESVVPIQLPGTRGKAFRTAVLARVAVGSRTVSILAVHLDGKQDRLEQLRLTRELFHQLSSPAILLGDFNTRADEDVLKPFRSDNTVIDVLHAKRDSNTPNDHIDWIFAKGLDVVRTDYRVTAASDHPVVLAEFRLREEPE